MRLDPIAALLPYYEKSWALVIGINDYGGRHARHSNAVNDARSMTELLQHFGFETIHTLYDSQATRSTIIGWLRNELPARTQSNDRIVFFFAGHGATQSTLNAHNHGYLIPYDGSSFGEYIDMETLRQDCSLIRAKHILLLLDCCFSGVAAMAQPTSVNTFLSQGNPPMDDEFLRAVTQRRAWQVLTAGAADELVADSSGLAGRSAFTAALVAGLEGAADHNRDGLITAQNSPHTCVRKSRLRQPRAA